MTHEIVYSVRSVQCGTVHLQVHWFGPPSGWGGGPGRGTAESTGVATFRTGKILTHPCQSLPPRL
eukprot:2217410-Prymnesium_polylepis.1